MDGEGSAVLGGGIYDTQNSSMMFFSDAEMSDLTGNGTGKNVVELGLLSKGPSPLPRTKGKPNHSALQKRKELVCDLQESLEGRRVQRLFIAVNIVCLVLSLTAIAVAGMAFKKSATEDSARGSASKQERAEISVPGEFPSTEVYTTSKLLIVVERPNFGRVAPLNSYRNPEIFQREVIFVLFTSSRHLWKFKI